MNEQGGKKILNNKTTLFSLKAELFKKQEEIKEKRQLLLNKLENFKPPVKSNVKEKPDKEYKKSFKDSLKAVDTEELEACRKAKLVLEKKAALYEHLSDPSGNSELAGRFLVDFNTKKQQEPPTNTCISDENEPIAKEENIITNQDNNADEWTEYTDCLGRTRKCLKSDYELFVWRDKELLKTMIGRGDKESTEDETTKKSDKPLLVEKTNDYLQTLREKWEQKEKELLAKDKDIHYQDLLFDEARMHGVGYYAFSTDESERKKQMEELMKRRQETLSAQKETKEIRKKREELMAARVAAARARQRLRAGLPPEDPQEMKEVFEQRLLQFLNEQKDEVDAKAKEEEKRLKEEQEKERQKLREAYIREWDLGKEGVKDKVKFREMSQEEYVEQQRNKRIDEFAPPQASSSKNNQCFDESGNLVGSEVKNKSWDDVRPKARTPTPPHIGDLSFLNEQKGLYFSTSMKRKFKNFVQAQEPTPIINELDVEEESPSNIFKRKLDSGIEIEPPTTYDYYGPVPKYTKSEKPFYSDIREAYSQGTRSLESKSNTKRLCNQYDFTFD